MLKLPEAVSHANKSITKTKHQMLRNKGISGLSFLFHLIIFLQTKTETTSSGTEKKTRPAEKGTVSDLTLPAEQGDETGATQQTSVASTSSSEFSVVAATDFTMVPVHDIGGILSE